ncbi:MAG: IMP dehydrogenase, partial [Candidatus Azotimanducaceae bacterium]
MAKILQDISRTFSEYLLIPRLTRKGQRADQVNLSTPLSALRDSVTRRFHINVPVTSACMQAVSGTRLAIALARQGGLSFIFCSQAIETQAEMVRQVKAHKAGFVQSDSNATTSMSLEEVSELMVSTGHSTVPVTDDGSATGRLEGIITDKDFWQFEDDLSRTVGDHMTPFADVIHGHEGISLREANELLHKHKKDCLPV